jgi:hypothetical protein
MSYTSCKGNNMVITVYPIQCEVWFRKLISKINKVDKKCTCIIVVICPGPWYQLINFRMAKSSCHYWNKKLLKVHTSKFLETQDTSSHVFSSKSLYDSGAWMESTCWTILKLPANFCHNLPILSQALILFNANL